jgi:regulator of replication initiation timing
VSLAKRLADRVNECTKLRSENERLRAELAQQSAHVDTAIQTITDMTTTIDNLKRAAKESA